MRSKCRSTTVRELLLIAAIAGLPATAHAQDVEPNNDFEHGAPITLPLNGTGCLSSPADVDFFRFTPPSEQNAARSASIRKAAFSTPGPSSNGLQDRLDGSNRSGPAPARRHR